jgi:exo-beta-1,3-glucanase (GH17 family)
MAYYFGVCYGARRIDQPTEQSVDEDMRLIAERGLPTIRTYGVSGPDQWNLDKATKHGLEIAVGVWVTAGNPSKTNAEIDLALSQADQAFQRGGWGGDFDLVIGNEVNRTDKAKWTPQEILDAMKYARQAKGLHTSLTYRVTSCFSGTVLQDNPEWRPVVEACERIAFLTVYPWYGQKANNNFTPGNIDDQMNWSWQNGLQQVVNMGKNIAVAEIGWPTDGDGGTTIGNQQINYAVTKRYLNEGKDSKGNPTSLGSRPAFWFEMFDEPWKAKDEGAWGSHWGIYTKDAQPKWT